MCEVHRLGPAILVYVFVAIIQTQSASLLAADLCEACDSFKMISDVWPIVEFLLERLNRLSTIDILRLGRLSRKSKADARVRFNFTESWSSSFIEILPTITAYQDVQRMEAALPDRL
mmetsp:Transcript_101889/g.175758  ORF Transcript_101889/g.175758 Transcript_101889/m.175758 type:complete len:117 (+) Transcript_101889:2-352(+)